MAVQRVYTLYEQLQPKNRNVPVRFPSPHMLNSAHLVALPSLTLRKGVERIGCCFHNLSLLPRVGDCGCPTVSKMSWSLDACIRAHVEESRKPVEAKGCSESASFGPDPTTKPAKFQITYFEKKKLDLCPKLSFT